MLKQQKSLIFGPMLLVGCSTCNVREWVFYVAAYSRSREMATT